MQMACSMPACMIHACSAGIHSLEGSTTSTIAEANIDITRSLFVRSRQRSTTYRLQRSSYVALFSCGDNTLQLQ